MHIHHLNCATICPLGGRLLGDDILWRAVLVCHCLLIEWDRGLVLVDTGLGLDDVAAPIRRLGAPFVLGLRPRLDPEETAIRQIERLGFKAGDVRDIVLTHLDLDHAGALSDFPRARVHLYDAEHAAAMAPATRHERFRYRAALWAHGPDWALHAPRGERWHGFECVRAMEGLPPELLLVPLLGHTRGHSGVAVRSDDGWLLHAGDAYFFRGEMDPMGRRCPVGLDLFQRMLEVDGAARLHNQDRLRALAREHEGEVTVFCAHDPVEFERLRTMAAYASGDRQSSSP